MKYTLDDKDYDVIIEKKNNKNLYIRVKEDMKIYVTCNYLTTKNSIVNILKNNENALRKMINRMSVNNSRKDKFLYLGHEYNICFSDVDYVKIIGDTILTKDQNMLNKWYKDEIIRVFDDRYVYVFNHFNENITSPILKIRTMKTRWGVYNRKNHTITLNSKLIEYDYDKIDYVIVHELSHIIHFNHSKNFWELVGKYCKDYKKIRRELKE